MIINGNTFNIAALATTSGATSVAPTTVSYGDLVALFGSVDAAYSTNGKWVMSSATRALLMGIISTTGAPILQTDPVNGQPFSSIFGHEIVIAEAMPPVAALSKSIYFGDTKSAYRLRTAGQYGIKRLN
jgi:HK97 family phage major capsid protein